MSLGDALRRKHARLTSTTATMWSSFLPAARGVTEYTLHQVPIQEFERNVLSQATCLLSVDHLEYLHLFGEILLFSFWLD